MTVRSQAYAALRICYFNGILPLWRSPLLIAAVFLTPFSFLFFLFVIAPRSLFPYGVVGGVLFTALFTGSGMLNDCAYLRLERQLQQVFVASPVRPIAYILGMALSELAFSIPASALFLAILFLVTPVGLLGLGALLGIFLLTWLMATTLGFFVSTMFSQLREIWPIGTLIFSILSILPPIFYPATVIPAEWRWVAYFAPSTYSAQLADRATGLGGAITTGIPFLNSPFFDLGMLVAVTLLFGLAAVYLARWRER
ncbi:MAG TPA: ABC transporter permease [Thermoplasmata archaeon]|nr:ABC transporter permease [Thermoplasmata archaeon]